MCRGQDVKMHLSRSLEPGEPEKHFVLFKTSFWVRFNFVLLRNLWIQRGAQTHDSEIKSRAVYRLSRPDAPREAF